MVTLPAGRTGPYDDTTVVLSPGEIAGNASSADEESGDQYDPERRTEPGDESPLLTRTL